MNGEHKITSSHRERTALVYPRQSSMAQLREHTESTRSQYGLAETAASGGLYWLIPTTVVSLAGGVVNAWLFLVKVTSPAAGDR